MKTIDLNCDMGELMPGQEKNYDAEIMPFISSCNIACGFHSGSPELMEQTIRLAIDNKAAIGAHPSYDDRENFGRVSIAVDWDKLMVQLNNHSPLFCIRMAAFDSKRHYFFARVRKGKHQLRGTEKEAKAAEVKKHNLSPEPPQYYLLWQKSQNLTQLMQANQQLSFRCT